jgi:hypothetical protein
MELLAILAAINPQWKSLLTGEALAQALRTSEIARPWAEVGLTPSAPVTRGFAAAVVAFCRERQEMAAAHARTVRAANAE